MEESFINKEKVARFGKPSLIFGRGQERRFNLVKKHVSLASKRILDVGCGIGLYSKKFLEEGAEIFGIDADSNNIKKARQLSSEINFLIARSEDMPWKDGFFDMVFLHEVLEHVGDDKKTISESLRVLKSGGTLVIFAPNRFFPFETHGIYLGRKYIYGNIPFINWFPLWFRNKLCPHVRIYTLKSLKELFPGRSVVFETIFFVFPAFDKIEKKWPFLGKFLKRIALFLEGCSFFKNFGISIFMVVRKP